jgi:hypothetical protein
MILAKGQRIASRIFRTKYVIRELLRIERTNSQKVNVQSNHAGYFTSTALEYRLPLKCIGLKLKAQVLCLQYPGCNPLVQVLGACIASSPIPPVPPVQTAAKLETAIATLQIQLFTKIQGREYSATYSLQIANIQFSICKLWVTICTCKSLVKGQTLTSK